MKILIFFLPFLFSACITTEFTGNAHIKPKDCRKKCANWGLTFDGMVAIGEFSTGCVCSVNKERKITSEAAVVGAGIVGVEIQRRRNIESQRDKIHQHHQHFKYYNN